MWEAEESKFTESDKTRSILNKLIMHLLIQQETRSILNKLIMYLF